MEKNQDVFNSWENTCKSWDELFAPPGRPSENDIKNFKKIVYQRVGLNQKDRLEVLLLGATPEIRDMFAEDKRFRVTLIDKTINMVLAMTNLMKAKSNNEIWVISYWQDTPLKPEYFDIVISDLVICNIFPDEHDLFLSKIKEMLKPGGHWLNRVYCIDENTKIRSLDQLIDEYVHGEVITKEDVNNFRSTAGLKYWDPKSKILEWGKLLDEMTNYRINGEFSHINDNAVELLTRSYNLVEKFNQKYWIDTKDGTESLFKRYFSIENVIRDTTVVTLKEKGYYIYDLKK
ncbi:class I SAM-dependent methyltransferase [Desulfosporosinus sp. PR]|uniref:class I SAM-dependent methyltransferase n=1 Tax=Candidatus Desulfosporosinus nitrosoreducens TaxID=3401928 RepID=UPI0027F1779A|nr:class I SAM-dependent methyltransferase [Desulfosporosinus sp. PR]MDQ7094866.1 class I SAM-dependent methyltransferase [Desulfosporosinus sp. PR]